jgi:hypothetical protein
LRQQVGVVDRQVLDQRCGLIQIFGCLQAHSRCHLQQPKLRIWRSAHCYGSGSAVLVQLDSGQLSFDADGTGGGVAVNQVTLVGHPALTAVDIVVV